MTTDKATPRPWHWINDQLLPVGADRWATPIVNTDCGHYGPNPADRELIVAAVNAYDAHRAVVTAARELLAHCAFANVGPYAGSLRAALAAVEQAEKGEGAE